MKGLLLAAVAAPLTFIVLVGGAMSTDAATDAHVGAAAYPESLPPPATPYAGTSTGCALPDPTRRGGCITGATRWLLHEVAAKFGPLPVSCWDEHAWNPGSDHPRGRACDYTFGTPGQFPGPADTQRG